MSDCYHHFWLTDGEEKEIEIFLFPLSNENHLASYDDLLLQDPAFHNFGCHPRSTNDGNGRASKVDLKTSVQLECMKGFVRM